jgi:hypothetical protein
MGARSRIEPDDRRQDVSLPLCRNVMACQAGKAGCAAVRRVANRYPSDARIPIAQLLAFARYDQRSRRCARIVC